MLRLTHARQRRKYEPLASHQPSWAPEKFGSHRTNCRLRRPVRRRSSGKATERKLWKSGDKADCFYDGLSGLYARPSLLLAVIEVNCTWLVRWTKRGRGSLMGPLPSLVLLIPITERSCEGDCVFG